MQTQEGLGLYAKRGYLRRKNKSQQPTYLCAKLSKNLFRSSSAFCLRFSEDPQAEKWTRPVYTLREAPGGGLCKQGTLKSSIHDIISLNL
jgi:hypothetical protein